MQNKTALVVGAVIIVLGAGLYFWMGGGSSGKIGDENTGLSGKRSLKELLAGGSQTCTVNSSNDISSSQGTVYVSGGKMRGDFTSTVEGRTMESHMISDGTYNWIWTSGMMQGFKMKVDAAPETSGDTSVQNTQAVDLNTAYDYDCKPLIPSASLFVPPSDVTFSDYSSMMPTSPSGATTVKGSTGPDYSPSGSTDMKAAQCGACDQITDPTSKTQCKQMLGCK